MRAVWLFAFTSCAACALDDAHATAIVVSVKSELPLVELDYHLFRENADLAVEAPISTTTVPAAQLAQPFVVVRGAAEGFLIAIEGYGERSQEPLIRYHARARFESEQTLALRVTLARICEGRACAFSGLTCYGQPLGEIEAGTCAAIPMPPLVPISRAGEESEW